MGDKVLIIEDEPNAARMLEYALQSAGYQAIVAATGQGGMKKVQSEQPDLVILDIALPDISGIEICKGLRSGSAAPNLPIIMLSGRAQVADKIQGLQAGADEYITKPAQAEEMVARVVALLERTRRLRQAQPLKRAKVLGLMGAKGGAGTTTVALNIAAAWADRRKKTVIAVELRSYPGSFSLQMQQAPATSLKNLLDLEPDWINEQALSSALARTAFGPRVLFGPQRVEEFQEIAAEQAEAVIRGLASMADYLVIDLPCHPCAASQAAMRQCDLVLLVLEPEPTSVMSGKTTMAWLRSLGLSGGLVGAMVVIRSRLHISLSEIKAELGCDVIGVMPPAAEECVAAARLGRPLVHYRPDHMATRSLIQMAGRLAADRIEPLAL